MARRIIEQLVSDLSGDDVADGKGETIDFVYRGKAYTIDLTDKEAAGFDKAISMYLEHATRVTGSGRGTSSSRRSSGSGRSKEELGEIRAWAQQNGHEVSERGRIKSEVLEAYDAAH